MALGFLKKLIGGGQAGPASPKAAPTKPGEPDLENFVAFVVRSLVDSPDSVTVKTTDKERYTLIQVACEKPDIGKVIGKSGKTIAAIRALANGAAGRMGKKVNVEILD